MARPQQPDPDGTFDGAQAVTSGTYSDSLSSGTDVDVFRFHLDAGQSVTLSTDNGGDFDPDTVLALFGANGRLLATDDDGGGNDLTSLLQFTNDGRGGDFYVAVSQFSNFPTGRGGGPSAPNYEGGNPLSDGGTTASAS